MTFSFTIGVCPRTKKTSNRFIQVPIPGTRLTRPMMLPSKAYEEFDEAAQRVLMLVRRKLAKPIDVPVNCEALFYRERKDGDAVGYYQALADTLQKAGIVINDSLIISWNGSQMLKDQSRPRIEVTLTTLAEMQESLPMEQEAKS